MEKTLYTEFAKVDEDLGLLLGFAIICTEDGQPYFDLQDDHIPEDAMLKAATDFMLNSREARTMHGEQKTGDVVFAFPLTAEVAKAFDITTRKTGLMIGVKPDSETLEKARRGEFTGFSIGGFRLKDEYLDE